MPTVPGTTNTLSDFPFGLSFWDGSNLADDFMARHDGEPVSKQAVADSVVGVADTTGENLDQDLG